MRACARAFPASQEYLPPSRLRQPAAPAASGWLPRASEIVELMQDDVWWEAQVEAAERTGTAARPGGRVKLRNRMTWESGWFDVASCRPSAAHLEFMRAGLVALDPRPARSAQATPTVAAGGSKRGRAAPPPPPAAVTAAVKRGRAAEPEDGGDDAVRAEAQQLLADALADERALADGGFVRAAIEVALLAGVHGHALDEMQRRAEALR
jgi:hypothetical protein